MVVDSLYHRFVLGLLIGVVAGSVGPVGWALFREFSCHEGILIAVDNALVGAGSFAVPGAIIASIIFLLREVLARPPTQISRAMLIVTALLAFLPGGVFGVLIMIADC